VALLTYLIANPDAPVNVVYKKVGVGAAKLRQIREELKAAGLLADLAVRTGRIGAGRPTKFLIPTFQALELLQQDPPAGRGGVIHRALQHVVMEGALAKGYRTKVEHALEDGAIVDVQLEKGRKRIAVEIAVVSRPEREMSHIKHCLAAGYDQVFVLLADENLLARTQQVIGETFSGEDAGRVRLLPLGQLTQVG
jgi:DNA-binding Lrp family transcriptional regulator